VTDHVLVIMRHAKAEQSESKRDIDRLLIQRGEADARAAGAWLAAQGISPDAVICSPSARTRGTWFGVAVGMESGAPTVAYEADLYYGGVSTMLDHIRRVDDEVETLLVIGHNPTVSGLSMRLDDARIRAAGGLRTAGIAVHRVTVPWADLTAADMTAEHTARA
jgi:phosphohistidine phosphatase